MLKAWQNAGTRISADIGGTEKGVVQLLEQQKIRIDARAATTDKFSRAQPVAAAWNAGRVLLPKNARWLPELLDEVLSFTGDPKADRHDDATDAMASLHEAFIKRTFEAPTPIVSS